MYCRMNRVECSYADTNGWCDSTACHNMNLLANCHNLENDTLPTQENKTQSDWHTGTPQEEGWYLLKVKSDDEIIYDTNRLIQCLWGLDWKYVHEEILEWQKIN